MSGFDNETVYATNIDLRGVTPIVGQFKNDGELLIGDATGGINSTPTGLRGRLVQGNGITIEYTSPNPSTEPSELRISSTATGAWTFIIDVTASNSSSVEFTDLSPNFCMYMVVMKDIAAQTNDVEFSFRTSSDNGSSFDSGDDEYSWNNGFTSEGNNSFSNDDTDVIIKITGDNSTSRMGNLTNEKLSGLVYIYDPLATEFTKIYSTGNFNRASLGRSVAYYASGTRKEQALVNAIQFSMNSGNITSGKFALYGLAS